MAMSKDKELVNHFIARLPSGDRLDGKIQIKGHYLFENNNCGLSPKDISIIP